MLTERILLKLSSGQMRDITMMAKRMKVPRSVFIRMALHYVTRMYPGKLTVPSIGKAFIE